MRTSSTLNYQGCSSSGSEELSCATLNKTLKETVNRPYMDTVNNINNIFDVIIIFNFMYMGIYSRQNMTYVVYIVCISTLNNNVMCVWVSSRIMVCVNYV